MSRSPAEVVGRISVLVLAVHLCLRDAPQRLCSINCASTPRNTSYPGRTILSVIKDEAVRMSFIQRVDSAAPLGYETPDFPSLYWPLPLGSTTSYYLYNPTDIWRFTTVWTLLFFGAVHIVVAAWACIVQWRNWKLIWIAPLLYIILGGIEALIAGSIVGGLLGAVYQAGYFRMSTWIPFVWALVNAMVLILSSFAIHGGL